MEDAGDEAIPLPNIKPQILEKIIVFCTRILENDPPKIERPLTNNDLNQLVDPWYAEFVNVEQEVLFDIVLAANYLDIPSLLDLSSAKVASQIKGRSITEIREYLHIVNDFTPAEENKVLEENRMAAEYF